MLSIKFLFLVTTLCCVAYYVNAVFTEKQIESGKRMMLNICKPRTNVTDDELEDMKNGDFDKVSRAAGCFINCVLASHKWQNKDNTFNIDAGLASLKNLPEKYHEEGQRVMKACKDAAKTVNDKCISAMEIGKCFYENSEELRKILG
ncbi:hypothetical protein HHI36_007268 [Cryptolaemus montrouzieri]|uniref:Uncharacterized protein n=1 Tax=Cryptolaemus montrouzieri TaxID=559131 RepID=A0ABD2MP14_9CUCU